MKNRILIVEDDLFFYEKLKDFLSAEGFEVMHYTPTYEKAVERLRQGPDAVLLDIYLKGEKNGFDVAKYIKDQRMNLPFIFLTSYDDHVHFSHALSLGPENFLSKEDILGKPDLLTRQLILLLSKAIASSPRQRLTDELLNMHDGSEGIRGLTSYLADLKESGVNELVEKNVKWDDIKYFSTNKETGAKHGLYLKPNYSFLKCNDNRILLTAYSLNKICTLTPYYFVRINDKTVVNLRSPLFVGLINKYNILMGDEVLKISKTYIDRFNDIYGRLYKPGKGSHTQRN